MVEIDVIGPWVRPMHGGLAFSGGKEIQQTMIDCIELQLVVFFKSEDLPDIFSEKHPSHAMLSSGPMSLRPRSAPATDLRLGGSGRGTTAGTAAGARQARAERIG